MMRLPFLKLTSFLPIFPFTRFLMSGEPSISCVMYLKMLPDCRHEAEKICVVQSGCITE